MASDLHPLASAFPVLACTTVPGSSHCLDGTNLPFLLPPPRPTSPHGAAPSLGLTGLPGFNYTFRLKKTLLSVTCLMRTPEQPQAAGLIIFMKGVKNAERSHTHLRPFCPPPSIFPFSLRPQNPKQLASLPLTAKAFHSLQHVLTRTPQ